MIRRLILAAALALTPVTATAQDTLATSTAPSPTLVRLPLVRLTMDGDRVVMQVVGSTLAPTSTVDGYYVGPDGYTPDISAATDVRGAPGGTSTANPTPGPMGAPGKSAYQIWQDAGNDGTQATFLASLRGQQGVPGGVGPAGSAGSDGKSAYQLWLDAGNTGSATDFLASLVGPRGEAGQNGGNGSNGIDGASAELRTAGGFIQARTGSGSWTNLVALADLVGAKGDQGDAGSNGVDGQPGAAATVSIGAVTTGAPGSQATVTNSGSTSAAIFNFTLPAGAAGSNGGTGATGATPNLQIGTITTLSPGASATAGIRGTAANPLLDLGLPAGSQGGVGPVGATGGIGQTGPAGTAATIAVGTVSTLAAGATPTVTNAGTASAAVLNFSLPRGAVFLNDVTLTQTAVVAIALGPRTIPVSTNCVVGDRMFMSPASAMPVGYQLGDIFCSANGTAQATLYGPLLAIGSSYSIPVKVTAFR